MYCMIENMIGIGKENAINLKTLANITNWSKDSVKSEIRRLRDSGKVIISDTEYGYYYPTRDKQGLAEVKKFVAMMEKQAKSRLYRVKSAKRWIKEFNQIEIDIE